MPDVATRAPAAGAALWWRLRPSELAELDRAAFAEIVRAARRRWDGRGHAGADRVLTVARAVSARVRREHVTVLTLARETGLPVRAVARLFEVAPGGLTADELDALAAWAGLADP